MSLSIIAKTLIYKVLPIIQKNAPWRGGGGRAWNLEGSGDLESSAVLLKVAEPISKGNNRLTHLISKKKEKEKKKKDSNFQSMIPTSNCHSYLCGHTGSSPSTQDSQSHEHERHAGIRHTVMDCCFHILCS